MNIILVFACGVTREQACGLYVGLHVREFVGDGLVFDDGLSELLAFVRVFDGVVEGRLGDADSLTGDGNAPASQD